MKFNWFKPRRESAEMRKLKLEVVLLRQYIEAVSYRVDALEAKAEDPQKALLLEEEG